MLCLAVAAADVATIGGHPLRRWGSGAAVFLWFDGAMLALAALFAVAARKVSAHAPAAPRQSRTVGPEDRSRLPGERA
ncbi:hypothetical protein SAMN04488125_1143 [Methylorubrum salsuginis]|uniref:Uncharacterized protein n=1 Tax=Methylorubrum salsuginis TaxID=414703 RepID=A0A1I4HAZ4_9HYPH|nr:hypothetical protein SAMN04488125_1143 [Methylorubrum salsuginis]